MSISVSRPAAVHREERAAGGPIGASVIAEDGEDAQELDVEPHDGHDESEGPRPRVAGGQSGLDAALDGLEIHGEAEGRHDDGEDADDQSQRNAHDLHAAHAPRVGDDAGEHEDDVDDAEQQVAAHGHQEDARGPAGDAANL